MQPIATGGPTWFWFVCLSVGQIGVQISTREGEVLKAKRAVDILKATKQGAAPVR